LFSKALKRKRKPNQKAKESSLGVWIDISRRLTKRKGMMRNETMTVTWNRLEKVATFFFQTMIL